MKITNLIVCLFALHTTAHSQGYLITNGVATDAGNNITVVQNPVSRDYTGFMLAYKSNSTFQFDPFLDEGVRTFIVLENDSISLQPIVSLAYPEMTYPNTYVLTEGLPFYLAFYTGYMPDNGIYKNPVFGWGKFVNLNGTIMLLDSALEYGGDGIYAGTLEIIQPVPEPATWALTAVGGLLLAWRHRVKDL